MANAIHKRTGIPITSRIIEDLLASAERKRPENSFGNKMENSEIRRNRVNDSMITRRRDFATRLDTS